MAIPANVLKKRKELSKDLFQIRNLLYLEFPNNSIFTGIENAITELNNPSYIPQIYNKPSEHDRWGYDADEIIFRFSTSPEKSKPHPLSDVELQLVVSARGLVNDLETLNDPFQALSFDIVINANCDKKSVRCTYHLDRHLFEEGDNESEEPHPWYHFQFGGKKLIEDHQDLDTGQVLFLNSPRIPHPPMDLILGIDFLVSNFFPKEWKSLTAKPEYNNLIEKYQKLFLKPYIFNFASQWGNAILNGENPNWTSGQIFPQFK
jgi:hypothetical protein